MKPGTAATIVLALLQLPPVSSEPAQPDRFPLMRAVITHGIGLSCAVLDAEVLSHAAPSLKDLRLLSATGEIPYTITLSETSDLTAETASLVQVRSNPAGTSLTLEMPSRPYTQVDLDLRRQNFTVKASVFGTNDLANPARTRLGVFTLFDLSAKHLSRNTVLPLQESAFRYLQVDLSGDRIPPDSIRGAMVPPSREAQTIYTPVARSTSIRQEARSSVASFQVPAHVPVERVSVQISPRYKENFSRTVHVTGRTVASEGLVESVDGTISRVDLGEVHSRQTAFPAAMGVNLQQDATFQVAIENAGEPPLPVASVTLETRQRRVCFDAPTQPVRIVYGDSTLSAPSYPSPGALPSRQTTLPATLGPELPNPAFHPRAEPTALAGHHASKTWLYLLAGLGLGAFVALAARRRS